ncbi:hypothetical protein J4H86_01680 [Spiractinospora alimapuensis]|uniref:hypothetical protein n=1 Tax=Spiractinospora alimapuensis TaxID=2820884 RepID=UPI001F3D206E|nr:hypothetical protein [Spiractinospora alimapuensis]QVQ52576.1 hypothetical protein J4H86_01680 [Spiractinospora alimapuensis]
MRHVFGFVLGLVMVPAVVVVPGWALPRLVYIAGFGGDFISVTGLLTVIPLVVLAVLVGVCLAVRRVSALACVIPAIALCGLTGSYVLAPELAVGALPTTEWGEGVTQLLMLGAYLPLGVMLMLPLFMPSRWRHPVDEEEGFDDLAEELAEDHDEDIPTPRSSRRGGPRHAARRAPEEDDDLAYGEPRAGYASHRR